MWILYAVLAAFFAGIMSIIAKLGLKNVNSNLNTALRTTVVAIFICVVVFFVGSHREIAQIDNRSLIFLLLSGAATGGSWLAYFKALKIGDVNKVSPIKKSSVILTVILAFIILREPISPIGIGLIVVMALGTYLMINFKKSSKEVVGYQWLFYGLLAAVFASLTSILASIGIVGVEVNLGIAIRTLVVLVMAWGIVFFQGKQTEIKDIKGQDWFYIILSALATGGSWLFFFRALQTGPVSVVVPIDKLSILVTIAFSYFMLKEKMSSKAFIGLVLIVISTVGLVFF